ncbi:hypothetical protein SPRG_01668 [Saprolegnia parasitica CBS 223.65]|uniref:Gamma-glutamylcyclotransferase AIG2-like domain-containing protein n=1 Tax=Saprolegnia parasitica (strain CBS 223.65) TaxID=695850 RepID=A0A067CSX4_SAPPC|nr:hypothetical protein SPRG_01668 [Saprolegnia parasitica CBS 223.65]KDO33789.1 hypothetical protein SPRG_01668 [Saprolegnia parasitica CBS 223.65]|eukprot:XP_012195425.1 hypothetical protein SPRG_01668 [Saprolegnia parasitica CBS 223.65]
MSSTTRSDESHVWYFAIGSMMNPISLSNRGLAPVESHPAEVLDYTLQFFGAAGMAEAVPEVGASFHGVLHKMTSTEMQVLDQLESTYVRVPAKTRLYDGRLIDATIYGRDAAKVAAMGQNDKPPSERYIEIMVRGCEHYGVAASHIALLKSVPFVPRKTPSEFVSVPVPDGVPTFTQEELRAGTGVREYIGSPDFAMYNNMLRMAGQPMEPLIAKMLYDPKYGCPSTLQEFTREHCACIEDMTMQNFSSLFQTVGLIAQTYKEE